MLAGSDVSNEARKAVATMSKRFTAEELAKLREIAEAATPGPWAWRMSKDGRIIAICRAALVALHAPGGGE